MNEVSKKLLCVVLINGVEIWKEEERLLGLIELLEKSGEKSKFIRIDDELINTNSISGIFDAQTMETMTRHKNGEWKCKYGDWHQRKQQCDCREYDRLENYTGSGTYRKNEKQIMV